MIKKCPACKKHIEKEFNYCPWCGAGIKNVKEKRNYGILGRNDNLDSNALSSEIKIPIKIDDKMMRKLLEQGMGNLGKVGLFPKIIKIKKIDIPNSEEQESKKSQIAKISPQEKERRLKLPKKIAKSKVKRFSDTIIYEIDVDEIKDKTQVRIDRLENGFEIKIFGKEYCFVKSIPLNINLIGYKLSKDKVIVEFRE